MQDQKAEGQQEHQLAAGDATNGPTLDRESAITSPSTPAPERKYDYAYYKSVFGSHPMPLLSLILICSSKTSAK